MFQAVLSNFKGGLCTVFYIWGQRGIENKDTGQIHR